MPISGAGPRETLAGWNFRLPSSLSPSTCLTVPGSSSRLLSVCQLMSVATRGASAAMVDRWSSRL